MGLLLMMLLVGCGAGNRSGGPVSVSGVADGMRITLILPRTVYPADPLIRAEIKYHNVSRHLITAAGTSCTQNNPLVQDLSPSGTVLFPDGVRWIQFIPDCGATTEDLFLNSGNTLTSFVYAVAPDPAVRAVMTFRHNGGTATVASPIVHLHFTRYLPPRVTIRSTPVVSATLAPRGRVHGQLLYVSADHCYPGSAPYDYLGAYWSNIYGRTIKPQCDHPSSWQMIAGWVGGSVANIHYVAR